MKHHIFALLLLIVVSPTMAQTRTNLPPLNERMFNQQVYSQLMNFNSRSTTEQIALLINTSSEPEATISFNTFRLFNRHSDTFDGYRSIPWYLRNVEISGTYPTQDFDGRNFSFNLKIGLSKKSHKWDEYWDSYFPEIITPRRASEMTIEWQNEQIEKAVQASQIVNQLLLTEGNQGFSLSLDGKREEGKWLEFSGSLIYSQELLNCIATINGAGLYFDYIKTGGLELSGQLNRELWPKRWTNGGLLINLAGSTGPIIYQNNKFSGQTGWLNLNLAIPIMGQARWVVGYQLQGTDREFISGISYQFLSQPQ